MTLGCWSLSLNRSTSRLAIEKQSGNTLFTATARPSKVPLNRYSPLSTISKRTILIPEFRITKILEIFYNIRHIPYCRYTYMWSLNTYLNTKVPSQPFPSSSCGLKIIFPTLIVPSFSSSATAVMLLDEPEPVDPWEPCRRDDISWLSRAYSFAWMEWGQGVLGNTG